MEGVVWVLVIGAYFSAFWPSLLQVFGNGQVFSFGGIIITILGLLPLVFVIGILKDVWEDFKDRGAGNMFLGG